MQAKRLDGSVFPKGDDLSQGKLDPEMVVLVCTRALRKELENVALAGPTQSNGAPVPKSVMETRAIYDAVGSLLRKTHTKMYA